MTFPALLDKLSETVFVNKCVFCGEIIDARTAFCTQCAPRVGNDRFLQIKQVNFDNTYIDEFYSAFRYHDDTRTLIRRIKFEREPVTAKKLGLYLGGIIREHIVLADKHLIPVPLSKERFCKRGYNQSELICRGIHKICGGRVMTRSLYKIRDNEPQHTLHYSQRKANVEGVYEVTNAHKLKGKTIFLIDDVYTSGSTVAECAKQLRRAGASSVKCITLTRAVGGVDAP